MSQSIGELSPNGAPALTSRMNCMLPRYMNSPASSFTEGSSVTAIEGVWNGVTRTEVYIGLYRFICVSEKSFTWSDSLFGTQERREYELVTHTGLYELCLLE